MSHSSSPDDDASASSGSPPHNSDSSAQLRFPPTSVSNSSPSQHDGPPLKRKRNLPGNPDPEADVIALSPKTLLTTNRFVCEICNKGFPRDQNLQLHRRGHNLPWKLVQRSSKEIRKRVYICPEESCVHHDPSRALGDLTGIKKHFSRKHGEKKWKCDKCSKKYAVQSDWKAHTKICGTREYRCDCGTLFSRRDSFITHRAYCDALAQESKRVTAGVQGGQLSDHSSSLGDGDVSPGRTTTLRFGGNVISPATLQKPGALPALNISRLGLPESGLSLVPSSWDQHASDSGTPSSRSGLSLWLGRGPGPGPGPTTNQDQRQLQTALDVSSVRIHPQSEKNNVQSGNGMARLLGSSNFENSKRGSGVIPACSPNTGGSQYGTTGTSLMAIPACNLARSGDVNASPGNGISISAMGEWTNRISTPASLFLTTAGVLAGSPNGNASQNLPSVSSNSCINQPQMPSAHLSATALLQKAAQMGVTASHTSLVRGFGTASSDAAWPSQQDQCWRANGMVLSSHPFLRSPLELSSGTQPAGLASSIPSVQLFGGNIRNADTEAGIHEVMNAFPATSSSYVGIENAHSSLGPAVGRYAKQGLPQGNGALQPLDRPIRQIPQQLPSSPLAAASLMVTGPRSRSKGEAGSNDGLTRDFLGVGGASHELLGAPRAGVGRLPSHRDISNITSFGQGLR